MNTPISKSDQIALSRAADRARLSVEGRESMRRLAQVIRATYAQLTPRRSARTMAERRRELAEIEREL